MEINITGLEAHLELYMQESINKMITQLNIVLANGSIKQAKYDELLAKIQSKTVQDYILDIVKNDLAKWKGEKIKKTKLEEAKQELSDFRDSLNKAAEPEGTNK